LLECSSLSRAAAGLMSGSARVPDHRVVAHEFVEKYYKLLQQTPEQLYKFYKTHSVFTFSRDSDGIQSSVTGQDQIRSGVMLALQPFCGQIAIVSKFQIDSQASRQGGLLVLVTGQLVTYDGYIQHFTQSFLLDKQELPTPGYFILCDFLRYVDLGHVPAIGPGLGPGGGVQDMSAAGMQCQDQFMSQQMGGMPMMSPHDAGQSQSWMQPRMPHLQNAPLMPQVHHAPVPTQPRQMGVHQMHSDQAPNGYPAAPSNGTPYSAFVSKQASQLPHQPAAGPSISVDGVVLEEPPRLPEQALIDEALRVDDALRTEAYSTDALNNVEGEGELDDRDEAQAEIELDMEDYDEDTDKLAQDMEAHDDGGSPATASQQMGDVQDDGAVGGDGGEMDEVDLAQFLDDEPESWASKARRLKEGAGQLGPSKVLGYGAAPGVAKAQSPTASSGSTGGAGRASDAKDRGADRGGAGERSTGAASSKNSGDSQYDVWLWISRLPMDSRIEGQELLDCLTSHIRCHPMLVSEVGARAVDIERRDQSQEWANVAVSSQEAADLILHLSRERKLLLRGKSIKADVHQQRYVSSRRGRPGGRGSAEGGSKGAGRGRGAALEGGGDDERSGEGRGAGRARRRPGKGQSGDARWTAPT